MTPRPGTPALRMRDVTKRYRTIAALDNFCLDVPPGTIVGMVGSNGAGKTTALTAAAGLLRLQQGMIDVLGLGPFDARRHQGRVTLLPQDAALPGYARVREVLRYYGRLQGLTDPRLNRDIDRLLARFDLRDRALDPIRTLSHGMRRRVCIVQAFLGDPELVLLDEPLNGLDPKETVTARSFFRECRGRQSLVISSHLLTELEAVCDAVAFVDQGRTVRQAPLRDVLRDAGLITYHLDQDHAPLAELRSALPQARIDFTPEEQALRVQYPANRFEPPEIHAVVLPLLLDASVRILESRLGSTLEAEYLKSHPAPPSGDPHVDARDPP